MSAEVYGGTGYGMRGSAYGSYGLGAISAPDQGGSVWDNGVPAPLDPAPQLGGDSSGPDTGGFTGAVLGGFKAGLSALSARRGAQSQKNQLGFEAQQAANNAAIAGYQAQLAQQAGAAREQDARLQTAAQFGADRAHMAASGIDLGQGSATDVLASTEYMGERQAMMIRDDTNRQVWQDRAQQSQYQAEQQYDRARMNAINPDMAAFGSLLGSL